MTPVTTDLLDGAETSWVAHGSDDLLGESEGVVPPRDTAPRSGPPVCEECGEEIAYSGRGRRPKYHPEHRPNQRTSHSAGTKRVAGSPKNKAERESAQIAESMLKALNKTALLVGTLDAFDGFAIAAGSPSLCSQTEGVLVRHDKFREDLLNAKAGGSIIGLVVAALTIALPILAHHGLIPAEVNGKPIGKLLEAVPQALVRLDKATKTAAETLAENLAEATDGAV